MEKLVIKPAHPHGSVSVRAAKNAVLPILACAVMANKAVRVRNCTRLADIMAMLDVLRSLGARATWEGDDIVLDCSCINNTIIDAKLTSSIRASIFLLGPLAARFGYVKMGYPGGCNIGARPIDIHIQGLRALGFVVTHQDGTIECKASQLAGTHIHLPYASVGATENIMMAASLISGDTTIYNAACEPEITDLAQFIVALGGAITVGDGVVHVRGAKELDGTDYTPIGDRIVAGTYLALAGAGGDITVRGVDGAHIQAALRILQDKGCVITSGQGFVRCVGHGRMRAAKNIVTRPYPGFATDLQAQFMAIECLARGRTKIVESVFESRYAHVGELCKMGACIDIDVRGDSAIVVGVQDLDGGVVSAQDLRGGAALVLAGVFCKDVTTVHGVHHIDRGYYKIESDLGELGVEVVRSAE